MQRAIIIVGLISLVGALGCSSKIMIADNFTEPLDGRWVVELEKGGTVEARDGALVIDVPGGCTVWFRQCLKGPIAIDYDVVQIAAGGPNDRVSDTNLFWMARDSRSPDDLFATHRSGAFADYNRLRCYYAGIGGNGNTTTRMRRYIGDAVDRPLLPQHDLRGLADLLEPNQLDHIRAVANGQTIQLWRNGVKAFELIDEQPYTSGWFGFRTVNSHQVIRNFHVTGL